VKLTTSRIAARALQHLLAALLLLTASTACPLESAPGVDVIVSPSLASTKLDRSLLRSVFTMRLRQWPDGSTVRVFVLPDSDPLSDQFYRERLGMYSYVLRRAWDRMVFTGTGFAPTMVQTEKEMIERVRSTPGAIGYVGKRELSESDVRLMRSTSMLLTEGAHD
jgi:ABC-type phosphate transport system substrate-binding protein